MAEFPVLLDSTFDRLIQESDRMWDEFRAYASNRHHLVIPCDVRAAHDVLFELRERTTNFLELGSATGVVTIMADLIGFEAYGIEIEPWLAERSAQLAEDFSSGATLVEGSFVPPDYQEEIHLMSPDFHTPTRGADAFDELSLELDDFDLIYCYPWPGDEAWLLEMIRRFARPEALLLTYDVSEGYRLFRAADGAQESL